MKKYMIVATTADKSHAYFYHGKDKKGVPILYGFLNYHNTKVYPRIFTSAKQADDVSNYIREYLKTTTYKSLIVELWTEEKVNNTIEKLVNG